MKNCLKQLVGVGHNQTMKFKFNSNNNSDLYFCSVYEVIHKPKLENEGSIGHNSCSHP